ncbi:hypothetical protein [Microbacterium sp. Leaf320]|uniref:hypothetical protein n=1 Tax=Microbacterium sp. Leaf320 TaxID=1736334 RepID=UPI0006F43733|nr:hypothetical protein [Microbacterium sp. Leaf320]KQQ65197.1 hypothetical protein ASF63_14665 [Microbacterium sp. Leaf320]
MARKNQYEIGVAMDTDGVEKSIVNGLVDPLEDAAEAFEDLEKAARSADLDKELTKAQKATDKLDDELDDTRESLKRLGFAARDVGDDSKRAFSSASENVEEFKNEAAQNFSEVTSSFDGSMDSILDLAQGTLGGLASGISGPLGIALGIAAAGIGLVVNGLVEGEEHAEELRERAREFAVEAVNAGQSTEAWLTGAEQIVNRIQELEQLKSTDWRWFWEKDPTQLQKWTDALGGTGRGLDEVEGFLRSGKGAQDDYIRSVEKSQDALYDEIQLRRESVDISDAAAVAKTQGLVDEYEAGQDLLDMLKQEVTVRDEATSSSDRQRDAGVDSARARMEAEEEAAEAIASATEAVASSVDAAYSGMVQDATEYATAEDGALDINRWLTYVQEHAGAVASYQANLQLLQMTPADWDALMAMPEESRTQWVAQVAALPEEARAPFVDALDGIAGNAGQGASLSFEDAFSPEADVSIDVDTDDAETALRDVSKKRTAEIEVKTTGKADAKADLDDLAKKRQATIDVKADMSSASATVAAWRRNQESTPITITVNARNGRTQLV